MAQRVQVECLDLRRRQLRLVPLVVVLIIDVCLHGQAISTDPQSISADSQAILTDLQAISSDPPQVAIADRLASYETTRAALLDREKLSHLGGRLELGAREAQLNELLMREKRRECDRGLESPADFTAALSFVRAVENITETAVFRLLQSMPKGGVLHAHDMALCSTDCLLELSRREHVWICVRGEGPDRFRRLRLARRDPGLEGGGGVGDAGDVGCRWHLLQQLREAQGAERVDAELRSRLTLRDRFADADEAWRSFRQIFYLVYGLLAYAPVWRAFFARALLEFHADGVQYLEFRTKLPQLYDLDGGHYSLLDTARILREESERFARQHEDFIGARMIFAPTRNVSDEVFAGYLDTARQLKLAFPDFVAGFDLVSREDGARPLRDFAARLLDLRDELQFDFYFHAGETNWFGAPTDENLIDAVLLGTRRIGHASAVLKHPEVLRLVRRRGIAIEVSPISNQVLRLIDDFRNHPAAHLFAHGYPVVVASDDPSFWQASPLSHDFYVAFLGIASRSAGLGFLKQLAWNSLKYSALGPAAKGRAFAKFLRNWDAWVERILGEGL